MTIQEVIEDEIGEDVELNTTLEALGLDSLDFLSLVNRLERTFQIKIEQGEIARMNTIADVVSIVEDACIALGGVGAQNVANANYNLPS